MNESIKNQKATIMRMAGNLASGLMSVAPDPDPTCDDWIAPYVVRIARQIVAEVERTEPAVAQEPTR